MTHAQAKQIFATHMQKARERKLAPYELKQLSQARQILRQQAKPVMNKPIRNSAHNADDTLTLKKAKAIAAAAGHKITDTGYDFKMTGKYFPTGQFSDSLDDLIATLNFEIKRHGGAFNPRTRNAKRRVGIRSNPQAVLIYGKVLRIEAQKTQPHVCDAECKRVNHRYYHDFTSSPQMYGLPDKSLLITHKRV